MSHSPLEGFEQVETLDSDEADEYEEEETVYVTLDLGPVDPNLLLNAKSYRLIGLETSQPFLQIGTSIFRGDNETLLGTEIILREPGTSSGIDSRSFIPVTTTEHRIRFQEVHLVPKETPGIDEMEGAIIHEDDITKRTLGGVSRQPQGNAFVPSSKNAKRSALFTRPKTKRRWHKRPKGYNTDEDEAAKKGVAVDGSDAVVEERGDAAESEHHSSSEEEEAMEENNDDDEMMSQDAEGSEVGS